MEAVDTGGIRMLLMFGLGLFLGMQMRTYVWVFFGKRILGLPGEVMEEDKGIPE